MPEAARICGACKHGCMTNAELAAPLDCRRYPPTTYPIMNGREIGTFTSYPKVPRECPACSEFQVRLAS